MKKTALQKFRHKLARDEPTFGLWVTLESASITEMAVGLGLDWVVIDAEHGHLDWGDLVEHLRATVRSETVALVRVAELNGALIKRILDIGADGIVVPWMETGEQLTQAVRWAHYPPFGRRGIGAERATGWGQCIADHVAEAEGQTLVIPLIESVAGGAHIDEMLDVPGVDVFFFGSADYSATAGYPGQWEGPGVAEKILDVAHRIRVRGKQCGVMSTSNENLLMRRDQGFRMLGLGADAGLLLRSLHESLAVVGRDRRIVPSLSVAEPSLGLTTSDPLPRPAESMRPDRGEVTTAVGDGTVHDVAPGVKFEELVGGETGARHLTTGIVTFAPGARLPYHRHTFDESLTLLRGNVTIEVDGRSYTLDPLDNVTVPCSVAHAAINPSRDWPATLHIAMATDAPSRELVDGPANHREMSNETHGRVGPEYVTRFRLARRYSLGNDAWFTDYCNGDLLPAATLSGGYGVFEPAGRLPAHLHDFDESICIIEGEATCVVEGRRYRLADGATALQPRGRVHYFMNESDGPMAMIWFYAGSYPERIVVDERCATSKGNPWKEEVEP